MKRKLPDLSRFELQCLRKLWARKEGTVREVHGDLPEGPSYSTVRKIFERLEEKGAVRRVRLDGRAWLYKPEVSASDIIRKEIRRLLDSLFDGAAPELVSHLAEMKELSVEDLRAIEQEIGKESRNKPGVPAAEGRKGS